MLYLGLSKCKLKPEYKYELIFVCFQSDINFSAEVGMSETVVGS